MKSRSLNPYFTGNYGLPDENRTVKLIERVNPDKGKDEILNQKEQTKAGEILINFCKAIAS